MEYGPKAQNLALMITIGRSTFATLPADIAAYQALEDIGNRLLTVGERYNMSTAEGRALADRERQAASAQYAKDTSGVRSQLDTLRAQADAALNAMSADILKRPAGEPERWQLEREAVYRALPADSVEFQVKADASAGKQGHLRAVQGADPERPIVDAQTFAEALSLCAQAVYPERWAALDELRGRIHVLSVAVSGVDAIAAHAFRGALGAAQ